MATRWYWVLSWPAAILLATSPGNAAELLRSNFDSDAGRQGWAAAEGAFDYGSNDCDG